MDDDQLLPVEIMQTETSLAEDLRKHREIKEKLKLDKLRADTANKLNDVYDMYDPTDRRQESVLQAAKQMQYTALKTRNVIPQ